MAIFSTSLILKSNYNSAFSYIPLQQKFSVFFSQKETKKKEKKEKERREKDKMKEEMMDNFI